MEVVSDMQRLTHDEWVNGAARASNPNFTPKVVDLRVPLAIMRGLVPVVVIPYGGTEAGEPAVANSRFTPTQQHDLPA